MTETKQQVFKIRNANTNDIPLIRELTFNIWPQTYATVISQDQISYMLDMMYSETSLTIQMTEEKIQFVLVYDDDEPIGFAAYQEIIPATWKLHKLYILPSFHKKGAGKFVLTDIINEIQQKGAASLLLQVNRHNTAQVFYEKIGFTVIEEADFDIGNGYFMNDYVMEKKF
jgi:ribosomal protein S18 acetylase RimI-like enzyme